MEHPKIVKAQKMGCHFKTEADKQKYIEADKREWYIALVWVIAFYCAVIAIAVLAYNTGYREAWADVVKIAMFG